MTMVVSINGSRRELADGATVATVVELLGSDYDGRGIAVAVNGGVVPRSEWDAIELHDGAYLEVLVAVQGG